MNHSTGIHCILELYECPFELLNDETFIRQAITMAADQSGSTLLAMTSHKFSPQGVTALGLLAESHISIHTWPETGYAAADVFTCGSNCDPQKACRFLSNLLRSKRNNMSVVPRGPRMPSNVISFPGPNQNLQEDACKRPTPHPPFG